MLWFWRNSVLALAFFLFLLHCSVDAQNASIWRTLNGSPPLVIARGGFSGLFPDSGFRAYNLANLVSLGGLISWCDVQLTKDNQGIYTPYVNLGNSTTITGSFPKPTTAIIDGTNVSGWFSFDYTFSQLQKITFIIIYGSDRRIAYYGFYVNIVPLLPSKFTGWFSFDYTFSQLQKITLTQGIYFRTNWFDFQEGITDINVLRALQLPSIWLNIQHDLLYKQRNLSLAKFLTSAIKAIPVVDYISSPEVGFLRSIRPTFSRSSTKLIFRFLEASSTEPTTSQTYASLLKNLTFVKTFASGILVPKNYILPVTAELYLEEFTSIVKDAHSTGLEVYASDFANDVSIAYDYNYNPISEYLHFIDNGNFSVDGVLTDFPVSASLAVVCFPHIMSNVTGKPKPLAISHNGASGIYPGCTDVSYEQAVKDRADFIDCPIQVTQDGILICQSSVNLIETTTVGNSPFGTRTSVIPELSDEVGVFTFNLTWEEIQTLKPAISTPFFKDYGLLRNPAHKNDGKFLTLSDFLAFAAHNSSTGVIIIIENAPFFSEKLGFDVIASVRTALNGSSIPNPKVMIMSTNSSVLEVFKQQTDYELVYKVDELISNVDSSAIQDIKKFASSVAVRKETIFPTSDAFITSQTKLVDTLHAGNLSVYVYTLRNEFVSQSWDFLSDAIVETHNFFAEGGVDGIISDFPATASSYKRNRCLTGNNYNIPLIPPGFLLSAMAPSALPPAIPPYPDLNTPDVDEPPLPPVVPRSQAFPPQSRKLL